MSIQKEDVYETEDFPEDDENLRKDELQESKGNVFFFINPSNMKISIAFIVNISSKLIAKKVLVINMRERGKNVSSPLNKLQYRKPKFIP